MNQFNPFYPSNAISRILQTSRIKLPVAISSIFQPRPRSSHCSVEISKPSARPNDSTRPSWCGHQSWTLTFEVPRCYETLRIIKRYETVQSHEMKLILIFEQEFRMTPKPGSDRLFESWVIFYSILYQLLSLINLFSSLLVFWDRRRAKPCFLPSQTVSRAKSASTALAWPWKDSCFYQPLEILKHTGRVTVSQTKKHLFGWGHWISWEFLQARLPSGFGAPAGRIESLPLASKISLTKLQCRQKKLWRTCTEPFPATYEKCRGFSRTGFSSVNWLGWIQRS